MPITTMPIGVTAVMLPELDFAEQLDLCRKLGVTHYSLRPRVISAEQRDKPFSNWGNHKFDLTPQRLLREAKEIRRQMDDAGVTPWGTVPNASTSDDMDALKLHFEGSASVGAGRVRVAPEKYPSTPFDYAAFLDKIVQAYGRIVELAQSYKQKVVIETHAWSLAASPALAWNIVRHFEPAKLGVIFDLPNYAREGNQQPPLAVSVLGPWIDHLHVGGSRRVSASYDALGCRVVKDQFCPLEESDLNLSAWLTALRDARVAAPLMVEDFVENKPGALRLTDSVTVLKRALAAL
jgi:sugar phosphate isomerase/epimerase